MKNAVLLVSFLALVACSTEQEKPKWDVKVKRERDNHIWVAKADGSRQCVAKGNVLTPTNAAQEMASAGVPVFNSKQSTDGKMHSRLCGAPTGSMVNVEISRLDLTKALTLGYSQLTQDE